MVERIQLAWSRLGRRLGESRTWTRRPEEERSQLAWSQLGKQLGRRRWSQRRSLEEPRRLEEPELMVSDGPLVFMEATGLT